MANRKLGKPSDQRVALLRNQTTALLWNGKIITTETRAKEIRSIAEKIITLAVNEYQNSETVEKETYNEKGQIVKAEKQLSLPHTFALLHIYACQVPLHAGNNPDVLIAMN